MTRLEAVCFWNRSKGLVPADVDPKFEVPVRIDFKQTTMLTIEPVPGGWLRKSGKIKVRKSENKIPKYAAKTVYDAVRG